MWKKILSIFFIIIIAFPKISYADENLELFARSAILIDASNGRVLYEKDAYTEYPMASTTKIMTCLYILENANLDDIVTVSQNAVNQPKVRLGMSVGQQYTIKDLLYALMLESFNDCAVALAETVSGSVDEFCKQMTKKAEILGAFHTSFKTPNGLDSENHYTTAYDLAIITREALKNEQFVEIINTRNYTFNEITTNTERSVYNKDAFLDMYNGAFGVKTGFTGNAGYCFVGAVKREDRTLISVVLASGWPPNKTYKWKDTIKLMDYGIENFDIKEIFESDKEFLPVVVEDGKKNFVELYIDTSNSIELLMNEKDEVRINYNVPEVLYAPIKENDIVGSVEYYINDKIYEELPIYAKSSIEKIDYGFCLWNIIQKYFYRN